jgi:hypothetical protein
MPDSSRHAQAVATEHHETVTIGDTATTERNTP